MDLVNDTYSCVLSEHSERNQEHSDPSAMLSMLSGNSHITSETIPGYFAQDNSASSSMTFYDYYPVVKQAAVWSAWLSQTK